MFREMRRKNQQLPMEMTEEIVREATHGVLALAGEEGYPYAVPISYVYTDEGKFIFHSAKVGHKTEALMREPKCSICIVDEDHVVPEEYTTYFRSVIAFGTVRILEDPQEIYDAISALGARYWPGHEEERDREIKAEFDALCMFEMTVDHMTGKEAIEYVTARKEGGETGRR